MANPAFTILFLAPSSRTDAILASGLVRRLRDEIEDARFTVVAGPQTAPLFREIPGLEDLVVSERKSAAQSFALWRRLRGRRWGLALDAAGGRLVEYLGASRRASARPSPDAEPVHKVVQAARLLKLEDDPPAPFLFTSDETRARAAELLGARGPLLAMAPASPWVGAAWPIERFARVAVQLLGKGAALADGRLVIVGDPDDWRLAETLRRSVPRDRWVDLSHEPDPLVTYACLQRASLFIGGSEWLSHLAASSGAPTLGLYGPTDDAVEGVWGPLARVVRGPRSFEAIHGIDPRLNQSVCHMMDLSADAVVEAASGLLALSAPKAPPAPTSPARRKRRHA